MLCAGYFLPFGIHGPFSDAPWRSAWLIKDHTYKIMGLVVRPPGRSLKLEYLSIAICLLGIYCDIYYAIIIYIVFGIFLIR